MVFFFVVGATRDDVDFDGLEVYQFNDDGMYLCKEFLRCTVANCMSHGMGLCQRGVAC